MMRGRLGTVEHLGPLGNPLIVLIGIFQVVADAAFVDRFFGFFLNAFFPGDSLKGVCCPHLLESSVAS